MSRDYCGMVKGYVKDIDRMCCECDRWLADDPPRRFVRPRLFMARRGLGVARLAFLAILGLLGTAAFRR